MRKEIKVFAPATVSNVGPGFDVFGFALERPGDEVKMKVSDEKGIIIKKISGDHGKLSKAVDKNTLGVALQAMIKEIDIEIGLEVELFKRMPLGSGLGSSAASAVAGVFALNKLLDNHFSNSDILRFALEGEKITSGGLPHADNIAPCLYGGFVIIRSINPLDVIQIPVPQNLWVTVVHPDCEIKTSEARQMLKKNIPLKKAVVQWGNTAALIAGFIKGDTDLIGRALTDEIIEPARAKLIPHFYKLKEIAFDSGALGCSISGSGPSIFALSTSFERSKKIGSKMKNFLAGKKINSKVYLSRINEKGPRVISK